MPKDNRERPPLQTEADAQTETSLAADQPEPVNEHEIAGLAYELWVARGRPVGNPDEDWYRAAEEIRSRKAITASAAA